MLVREVMTPNPIRIRPDSDYLAAIAIMRAGRLRRLPVVDENGAILGIVTMGDLRAVQPPQTPKSQAIQRDGVLVRVREIMSSPVVTIPSEYPLEEAARVMLENRIDCLLVTSGDDLAGIITETDIFRTFIRILGGGSDSIRLSVQVDNRPGEFARLASLIADVGGNILSLASHPASTPDRLNLTLRVETVSIEDLVQAIDRHPDASLLHIWTSGSV
jgi:acetoin utilization protein AcuB